jgi:hypothetical protein
MKRATAIALSMATLLSSAAAFGDAIPKVNPGWRLPVGLWTAVGVHTDATDGFVGGVEASFVHTDRDYDWWGFYADAVRDFASERTRLSIGPEIGDGILGIDGGYVVELGGERVRHGFAIRPLLSVGIIMIGGRIVHFDAREEETLGEIGLLFKFPIEVSVDSTPQWRRDR